MRWLILTLPLIAPLSVAAADFVTDIEPILKTNCYACHGEDQQLGQLRLDSRSVSMKPGPSGPRIVPGDAEASSLYQRISGIGEGVQMPMGGQLQDEEIAAIREWIEQGASWPTDGGTDSSLDIHWAFEPPERPTVPETDADWSESPIDWFVQARMADAGLEPSARASRETQLRRLSLDLTGLPPTVEELAEYLADTRPGAYQRQANRLLASPHHGERWGRMWLDAARYADSDGFEKDKPRRVWFYRDWVVNALNADMPYDEFVVRQIAGDLLPDASQDERVATGFLRNSMINEEGGANPEQFRMEAMFDRMDAIGKAVLGLTVQCAQCHDHKYDPFTQRDYYRMFAFINNSHESTQAVYTPEEQRTLTEIHASVAEIESGLRERAPNWLERMTAWEREVSANQPSWTVLDTGIELGSGEKYRVHPDKSILAQGYAPTRSVVTPEGRLESGTVRAFRLELLNDPTLPMRGPGRSFRGTAALTEFEVKVASESDPKEWKKLAFKAATADINPPISWLDPFLFPDKDDKRRVLGDVRFAIDGFEMSAWNIDGGPGRRNVPRKAVFQLAEPLEVEEPTLVQFNLVMKHGGWNSDDNQSLNLGRFRLSSTDFEDAVADTLPAAVRRVVNEVPVDERTPDQVAQVFQHWRTTVPEWSSANAEIEALLAKHPEGSSQLMMHERDAKRETHMLQRGDFLRPMEAVGAGVPGFLHSMPETEDEPRLAFAKWLVDQKSPTTARSIVNRIWQGYFGTGIVETSEDLGRQAAEPSHPALLDWLATELMDSGWSLKHIHRTIVTSETYRQSSQITPEAFEKDPRNRLLSRGSRFRVDGEIVRDIALAASGLLTPAIGGPPVYPPAPDFLFLPPTSYGPKRWYENEDASRYRRSLYAFRYRSLPYPVLSTFDTPTGNFACVKRDRSNTPLQALVTLNETTFMEAARELGRRTLDDGGRNDGERLDYAFRRVLSRSADSTERDELLSMLARQRERVESGDLDGKELALVDGAEPLEDDRVGDLAAWTAVSRVLLNLDETITRE